MRKPPRVAIFTAFAALYLIWGSTYLGILFAIESIPPLLMAGARFLCAGVILYAAARLRGAARPDFTSWRSAFIVGACLLVCGNGGVTISEQWVPTGLASLLVATVPIYMGLLSWLSGTAPRPTGFVWTGLLGGFAGVAILAGPALTGSGQIPHNRLGLGMCILLAGSLIWSIGSLYSRTARSSPSLFLSAGQQMICGGGLLLVLGALLGEGGEFRPEKLTALSMVAFVYLVLIGAIVGYTAYFWLLQYCEPAKVATYAYVNPIVAVLLGTSFAGETLSTQTIIAAVLIIGSVGIVITAQQRQSRSLETIPAPLAE